MSTPHKHADVLKAIADGKSVEWQGRICNGCWHDGTDTFNPIDDWQLDWRIKPELKPDVVKNFKASIDIKHGDAIAHSVSDEWIDCSNLKLTFDGETGKLKSAEVIA